MTTTTSITFPANFDTVSVEIDHRMAESILDKLGYTLQDLSLDYGDVVFPDLDICGQLYYGSDYSTVNLVGYVWLENDCYYSASGVNHKTMELAAIELIPRHIVVDTAYAIELARMTTPDYI